MPIKRYGLEMDYNYHLAHSNQKMLKERHGRQMDIETTS